MMKRTIAMNVFAILISTGIVNATSYYVQKLGDDSNPGTQESPFLTIGAATAQAVSGDTCFIGSGTYRETLKPANSGTHVNPIVYTAIEGDTVIISAMEPLNNWELDNGFVYKTSVDWDLGQHNFVMYGSHPCDLARWPNNTDGDPFTPNAYINTGGSTSSVITNAYLDYSPGIPIYNWKNGGSIYFYGTASGWTSWRAYIKNSSGTRVTFDLPSDWVGSAHSPSSRGEFYLQGIKQALDYENEWYYSSSSEMLFIQIPGGCMPEDGTVQMRKRRYTIDLRSRYYIEIRNIIVFGGSIEITDPACCNTLYGVSCYYGNTTTGVVDDFLTGNQSINITGSYNRIEKCDVAYGTGTGIWVAGTSNEVINCNIHDFDYIGDYDAPLMVRNGNTSTITHNTIYNGGRDCVQWFNHDSEFAYNKVYKSNLIADDCGLFYTVDGPWRGEIHHNLFFDAESRGSKYKAAGIYLDNDAEAFDVHHNVVYNTEWSSIQINLDAKDLNIYNNTLWDGSDAMDAWHRDGTSFTNINVWNNLADNTSWEEQADKQNNLSLTTSPFVDLSSLNFMLAAATDPIDYGREITGITDGFAGAAPDAGAYEYEGDAWTAGIDWEPAEGIAWLGFIEGTEQVCDTATVPSAYQSLAFVSGVDFFPNPVVDILNVTTGKEMLGAQLSILTINGIELDSYVIENIKQKINIQNLHPGIYLIQLRSGVDLINHRIIKTK